MVRAIKGGSTDGIGLGRPVCEEPDLPKRLISGEAQSAKKTLFDRNDSGTSVYAACLQLNQLAYGDAPFDSTNKKAVERFVAGFHAYFRDLATDVQNNIVRAGFAKKWLDEMRELA